MTINLADAILKTAGLNEALMRECDIFFCDKPRDTEYSGHGEIYSSSFETFAVDGSGGEYVKLEDGSIGYISSEGSVGRVAENMEDLFKFLIHAGCISDFSCKYIYKSDELLSHFAAVTSRNHASHIMRKVLISTRLEARLRRSYRSSMILVNFPSTQRDFTKLPAENHYSPASSEMEKTSLYVTGLFRIFSEYG